MYPEDSGPPYWGLPPSAFAELPLDVIEAMTVAILAVDDREFALTFADEMRARLNAAFEAGWRFGFRFRRVAGPRQRPPIPDEMIHAYEPFLCQERSTPQGIRRWLDGNRHQLGVALDAAELCGYFYRAAL